MQEVSDRLKCPICDRSCAQGNFPSGHQTHFILRGSDAFNCDTCGHFGVQHGLLEELQLLPPADRAKVSAYMRAANLRGHMLLLAHQLNEIDDVDIIPVTIGDAIADFPRTISARLDRAILNLAILSGKPGQFVSRADDQYPVFCAEDSHGKNFFVDQLLERRIIETSHNFPGEVRLTVEGWNRVENLERGEAAADSKDAFVAMWSHDEMDEPYDKGIRPAMEACGYEPLLMRPKLHVNKICDEIIADIRRSRFMVADFTGHRGGVYFEAGFALGLGKTVIWTCREDDVDDLHFDTRQYNHILWSTPEDLYAQLKARIQAVIPAIA